MDKVIISQVKVKLNNFFGLILSLWCLTWLNSIIVVEKWHHSLLNWSPIIHVFTVIFSLPQKHLINRRVIFCYCHKLKSPNTMCSKGMCQKMKPPRKKVFEKILVWTLNLYWSAQHITDVFVFMNMSNI